VATVPLSTFYLDHTSVGMIRFCFAKKEETLQLAIDKLKTYRQVKV
jgi:methionine aminotransferase